MDHHGTAHSVELPAEKGPVPVKGPDDPVTPGFVPVQVGERGTRHVDQEAAADEQEVRAVKTEVGSSSRT